MGSTSHTISISALALGVQELARRAAVPIADLGPLSPFLPPMEATLLAPPPAGAPPEVLALWHARSLVLPTITPVPQDARLRPCLATSSLLRQATGNTPPLTYALRPFTFHLDDAASTDAAFLPGGADASYKDLWRILLSDLTRLPAPDPEQLAPFIVSLLAILRRALSRVPATPAADLSLFEVSQTIAALASCLATAADPRPSPGQPVAVLLRGDLSGIQSFLYRITRFHTDATFRNAARRLRGRSFAMALLGDLLADHLLREFALPHTNLLYCGGGRFDILLPAHSLPAIDPVRQRLDDFILRHFRGALDLQFAARPLTPEDVSRVHLAYRDLDDELSRRKRQRLRHGLGDPDLYLPQTAAPEHHACRSCFITPIPAPSDDPCPECQEFDRLGRQLLRATHLAICHTPHPPGEARWFTTFAQDLGASAALLDQRLTNDLLDHLREDPDHPPVLLYRINDTDALPANPPRGTGFGFRLLATSAPIATRDLSLPGMDPIEQGDVFPFEGIARLSRGSALLGVLKADVDHLGLLLGHAAEGAPPPSLARAIGLSSAIDQFFCGWLNSLCARAAAAWKDTQGQLAAAGQRAHPLSDSVDGLFYTLYTGGDDLLVLGPWDALIHLADRLHQGFSAASCHNPNVTLSAGLIAVKPRYPVHRFAAEADAALDAAKGPRNSVHVFGRTLPWSDPSGAGLHELLQLAAALLGRVEALERPLPRTLLHDLLRLSQQHRPDPESGQLRPMWTPRLYYTLARRLRPEDREAFAEPLLRAFAAQAISVPISYVSYATRKEP